MPKCRSFVVSAFVACAVLSAVAHPFPAAAIDEPDRLWLLGQQSFADGLYPVARRTLDRFVAKYPDDPRVGDALLLLGRAQLALSEANAAVDTLARARALPTPPGQPMEARFWEAEALFRLKRWEDARVAYDDVLKQNAAAPFAPDAMYGLGWSELEAKHFAAAIAAFREMLKTWPDHAQAPSATLALARALINAKRGSEALPLLVDFRAQYPQATKRAADAQYLAGWLKVTTGDPRGGLADLRAFLAANPKHEEAPAARKLIAQTLAKYGNKEELADSYKMLMEQQPATADALYEAAAIAERLGRSRQPVWKRLHAEFPTHALTRRLALDLGTSAFKQKAWAEAASYGQLAAQSDDAGVKSEGWLLVGESELKREHFAEAAKAFEEAAAVGAAETGVRFRALAGLGLAREELKEYKAALAAYETVVSKSPDATLRDWAKERASAVRTHLAPAPPKHAS